jgi:hypothetical protein
MYILAALGTSSSTFVAALAFRSQVSGGGLERIDSSRYFTSKLVAPPLEQALDSRRDHESRPLDVVYTNDPHTLALWISDHLPSNRSTTIGFDTEVCLMCCPYRWQ